MKDISELKTVAERGLHELVADHRLKQKIIEQACAEEKTAVSGSRTLGRLISAAAAAALLFLLCGTLKTESSNHAPQITQIAAGVKSSAAVWIGEKKYEAVQRASLSASEATDERLIGKIGEQDLRASGLPEGTAIYRLEDGTLLAVTPDSQTVVLQEV